MSRMIILGFVSTDQVLKSLYVTYQNLFVQTLKMDSASKDTKMANFVKISQLKKQLEQRLAAGRDQILHTWGEEDLLQIDSIPLRAKLSNFLFTEDEFQELLEKEKRHIPGDLMQNYLELSESIPNQHYLLLWNIEESEWNALLSD
jgi:hypothetical protein